MIEGYLRVTQEQEIKERVGSEEVNYGSTQTPARASENSEPGDHQKNRVWQGDFATLRSLRGEKEQG